MELTVLFVLWSVLAPVRRIELTRLLLGWLAMRKARPEDVPVVMKWAAKWESPSRSKRR